jgi:fructose-1,6-bisphosphatase I
MYIDTRLTLVEQFVRDQSRSPGATGELSTLLSRLSLAGRLIANEIMRAGFVGKLGFTGDVNVQAEQVRALDVIANDVFIKVFESIETVSCLASEEMEDIHRYDGHRPGKYLVLHDPLDGSSNVDIDGSMGTIFSIHRRPNPTAEVVVEDFFKKGAEQVVAGYILVNGFTLDRAIGAFFVTHPDMKIPASGGTYAVNEANEGKWDEKTKEMVRCFRTGKTDCGVRAARYVGALVADFHRTLCKGGIYMYPGEAKNPKGKLRLLYEAAPLALVARQAGGFATDGKNDILQMVPTQLHQRCPLFIGSRADVEEATRRIKSS